MNRIAAVVAGLSLAFVGTSATIADTINVPGDQPTIAAAISASVNGDVINIAAGTYNEANLNPGGKAITIQGTLNGDGTLATTIDATGWVDSVFEFGSGEYETTVIKDLVITGGLASIYGGGGIFCDNSSPTISGCTISGNWALLYGGGIYCNNNSTPTISGCTITGNTANSGGGIFCDNSSPTIIDCTFEGNTGGGIRCSYSNPIISGCTISGNSNGFGGGIYCEQSSPTITGCTIENNTADIRGGGIYCSFSSPTITGCTFTSNMPDTIVGDFNTGEPASTTGACCVSSGCHALTEDACAGMGGTWLGEGGSCDDCVPAEPTGACCVSSGCVANSNDDCTALGGTWLGEDASCDDCAPTCQGDANADGTVDVFDLLKVIDGWGICD